MNIQPTFSIVPAKKANMDSPFSDLVNTSQAVADFDYLFSKFSFSEAVDQLTDAFLNATATADQGTQMMMTKTLNHLVELFGIELE